MAKKYRINLYDGGKAVNTWFSNTHPNFIYQNRACIFDEIHSGNEITICGTFVVEEFSDEKDSRH